MFKKIGLIILLIAIAANPSFNEVSGSTADPSEIGVGARPLAIGKAFVGMEGDASNIFINPAGLAYISSPKVTSMSGQVIQDVSYTVIGGANPTDYGTFGIGYI